MLTHLEGPVLAVLELEKTLPGRIGVADPTIVD